jgi:hypothetical protein
MTLLERLSPSYKTILDSNKEDYPALIEYVFNHLSKIKYVIDMKFGVWLDIKSFTNVDCPYDLFEIIQLLKKND